MTVLKVIEWPAKVLETRAKEVEKFDSELAEFVENMHETMRAANGIGLAANQVDDLRRVLVIEIPWSQADEEEGLEKQWWHGKKLTFINPEIVGSKGQTKYQEGCLSFPGIYEFIQRNESVTVRAKDVKGETFEIEADGLLAICLQHEIDHLDGVIFINRMSRLKANIARKKLMRRVAATVPEEV